jgi:hypothetical protein
MIVAMADAGAARRLAQPERSTEPQRLVVETATGTLTWEWRGEPVEVGTQVVVPLPFWAGRGTQVGTVVAAESDYPGALQPILRVVPS